MPQIRYTLRIQGEEETFSETDYWPAYPNETQEQCEATIRQVIVEPLNKRREALKEMPVELLGVTITNPLVHLHSWKRTRLDKFALKAHYFCERCGITGYKKLHLFQGELGHPVIHNDEFNKKKYDLCKDPLKPMPKTLNFA